MPTKIIVTKPSRDASELVNLLIENNFNVVHLPVFEVIAKNYEFEQVEINSSNCLFFSSPASIDLSVELIKELSSETRVIVPGRLSAMRIKSINSDVNVIYPKNNFGIAGLIEENLLSKVSNLTIFGGSEVNLELENYCINNHISIKFISLYNLQNIWASQEVLFKQLILNSKCFVIVSSSGIAKVLYDSLEKLDHCVKNIVVVSLHAKISKIFQGINGLVIIEVFKMDNNCILQKLKEIN